MFSALRTRAGSGRRHPRTLRPTLAATIGILLTSCTSAGSAETHAAARMPAPSDGPGSSGRVYVTNQQDNTLSVIDAHTYKVLATVRIGTAPEGVAVTPDGRNVYIANNGSAQVSVLDTRNNKITTTVSVEKSPTGVSITPDGRSLYVANGGSNTVSVIDTGTNRVTARIPVG
ncbi:YncE family protein, partial [Streptomyces mirabilis]|uniref:YncE family protein n=1 Tax=Streptomyces mirabilis TaxID=68239 RepID=UPI0036D8DAA7